MFYDSLT